MNEDTSNSNVRTLLRNISETRKEAVAVFFARDDQSDLFPERVEGASGKDWKRVESGYERNTDRTGLPFKCYAMYVRDVEEEGTVEEAQQE